MNIAVGIDKISEAAKRAIESVGGRIEATLKPDVSMVVLPNTEITTSNDMGAVIELPEGNTLYFSRAWHTKDCSLITVEDIVAR